MTEEKKDRFESNSEAFKDAGVEYTREHDLQLAQSLEAKGQKPLSFSDLVEELFPVVKEALDKEDIEPINKANETIKQYVDSVNEITKSDLVGGVNIVPVGGMMVLGMGGIRSITAMSVEFYIARKQDLDLPQP